MSDLQSTYRPMRVFVSSTLVGLGTYRRAAERAIIDAGLEPLRLETIWPQPSVQERTLDLLEKVKAMVSECDALIRITTGRKGSRVQGSNRSWLDHELDAARAAGLRIFVYTHPEWIFANSVRGPHPSQPELELLAQCDAFSPLENPEQAHRRILRDLQEWLHSDRSSRSLVHLPSVSADQIRHLLACPRELADCTDRFFEQLVAELLAKDGWEVQLVVRSNAPGPDIIACNTKLVGKQPIQMLVECKRYSERRRVDVREVRNLVYWLNEEYGATLGMIATTSQFTSRARGLVAEKHQWRISLQEQGDIIEWLSRSSLYTGCSGSPANTYEAPGR